MSDSLCVRRPILVYKTACCLNLWRPCPLGGLCIAAPQDEVRHTLRVTGRIGDRSERRMREPKQSEPLEPQTVCHRLQICHSCIQGEVYPLAVGHPCPSQVIPNERCPRCQPLIPGAKLRILPLQLNMAERERHVNKGRALPQSPEGDAHAILGLGVLDAPLHQPHSPTANTP